MSAVIELTTPVPITNGNLISQSPKLRPITVKQYDSMIKNGIFDENDKIELLNGVIIEKMSKGTKHATLNDIIATNFIYQLGRQAVIRNQNPIWLDDFSEPEPDIVLVETPVTKYFENHPTPNEIYLILEISDTTLSYDRNDKCLAYSKAGIRQYLLLNVQDRTIEDYREPSADGYQSKQTFRAGQTFNLVAFPEHTFKVEDFLPIEKV